MERTQNLDIDLLRTFVVGIELGSFARAAELLGRSGSAVSLQLRRLEQQADRPLVRKQGRGLALTEAGATLLDYARQLLRLNDEAIAAVRGDLVGDRLRLGLPPDFADSWLREVLAVFAHLRPEVRVETLVECRDVLIERIGNATLDLALIWRPAGDGARSETVARVPVVWVGRADGPARETRDPVPLVVSGIPCVFRQAGIAALEAAGIPFRITYTSSSLAGLTSGVAASLGITVRTAQTAVAPLIVLDPPSRHGLPELPAMELSLQVARQAAAQTVAALAELLRDKLRPPIDDGDEAAPDQYAPTGQGASR